MLELKRKQENIMPKHMSKSKGKKPAKKSFKKGNPHKSPIGQRKGYRITGKTHNPY